MQPSSSTTFICTLAIVCSLAGAAQAAWVPPTPDPTAPATLPFGKHSTLHLSSPDRPYLTCDVTGTAAINALGKKAKLDKNAPVTCDRQPSPFFWDAWKSGYILAHAENSTKVPGQGHFMPSGGAVTIASMATKKACAPVVADGAIVCNASKSDPGASFRVYLADMPSPSSPAAPSWLLRRAVADLRSWLLRPEADQVAAAVPAATEPANGGAPIEVHLLHVVSNRFCAPGADLHAPLTCDVDPASLLEDDLPPVVLATVVQLWPAEAALDDVAEAVVAEAA